MGWPTSAGADEPPESPPPTEPVTPAWLQGRVVIMRAEAHDVTKEQAQLIGGRIADHFGTVEEIEAIHVDELDAIIEQQRLKWSLGCADDSECMAELAAAADAPSALFISMGKIGTTVVVNLAVLNTASSAVLARVSETFPNPEAAEEGAAALVRGLVKGGGRGAEFRLPEGKKLSLAVFDFATADLSTATARNLSQVLTVQLADIDGVEVISSDDIRSMLVLTERKLESGCLDETACLAEIGGALGVDLLLIGHAGKLGTNYIVALRLLDVNHVRVVSRATETFKGLEEQLLPAVRIAGHRLLGFEDESPGDLVVTSNEQDAEVFVDGRLAGTLPLPALKQLTPGKHAVRLLKDGFLEWRSDVYVEPGGTTPLWTELIAAPVPWYERWWVWTLVGVGVAAVTGTVLAIALQPQQDPTASGEVTLR